MTAFARLRTLMLAFATFCGFASTLPPAVHAQFLDRKALKQSQEQQAAQRTAMMQMLARTGPANSAQTEADLLDGTSADQPAAAASTMKPGPKQPGVLRVGIVLPANQMSGQGHLADGEPVRAAEAELLHGPRLEPVKLTAIVPAQAMEEARLLDCDYVLTSTLTQQQTETTGGRFSKFVNPRTIHMATTAAQFIPGVGATAMMANMLAGPLLAEGLQSASRAVKANSDVTLEYTLTGKDGTVKLKDSEKVRAKSDAENVLTPMLSSAATKIVAAISN